MQALIVSLFAGVAFPLFPILAEYGITGQVKPDTWSLTGIVYAVAIGLVSRNQAITISGFFFSGLCVLIYVAQTVAEMSRLDMPIVAYGTQISTSVLYGYTLCYVVERYGRHYIENEPFL